MRMRKVGFTFTELLIVIAIIALVAALLFPIFGSAKEKTIEASCAMKLKQVHKAMLLYGLDYPGYERVAANIDIPYTAMWLPQVLLPYLGKEGQALHCPAAPACATKYWGSTYVYETVHLNPGDPRSNRFKEIMEKRYSDPNNPYPLVRCLIHDELHYYPHEKHLAKDQNPPYVIQIYEAGNVKTGRFKVARRFMVAEACSRPNLLKSR